MSITYPVFLPVPIKSDRFGLNINKAQFSGEFVRNRIAQSHGAGTTDRWEGVYTTPFLSTGQHSDMSVWLEAMSQDDGTFFAFNPNSRGLKGSFDDDNLLATNAAANQSGSFIYLDNIPISSLGLKVNDIISTTSLVTADPGSTIVAFRINILWLDINEEQIGGTLTGALHSGVFTDEVTEIINKKIPIDTIFIRLFMTASSGSGTLTTRNVIFNKGPTALTYVEYLKVDGASQTGNSINIKDGPISVKGILRRGDMVQIQTQLYRAKARVDTDGAGKATIEIGPAIRAAHPDSEPILVKNPVMIAQLVQTDHPQETNHNSIGVVSFAWQEVV